MRALLTLVLLASFAGAQTAQSPGQISGRATDKTGGAFERVAVTLEGPAWSEYRTVITDSNGEFKVPDLPPGTYDVEFRMLGWCPVLVESVTVAAGATARANGKMVEVPTHGRCPGETGQFIVRFETTLGNIDIGLDLPRAPITSLNFLKYLDGHSYDGGSFNHAVIAGGAAPDGAPVVLQGHVNADRPGSGLPPIKLEPTRMTGFQHVTGTVSMVRTTADSATSDFMILLNSAPALDSGGAAFPDGQGAAAFGSVLAGLDIVRAIASQSTPVKILSAHRVR
jgi:peptidyl-prolyl cis-trans isomerase A (cyclophilin A)